MMTVQEAAVAWQVNENTVRKWAREGKIKAYPLAEVLRQRGLPAPKKESWMIDQKERPLPGTDPIVREKRVVETVEPVDESPLPE